MRKIVTHLFIIFLFPTAGILQAQDIVRVNPIPLERPKPFTSIERDKPLDLFNELIDTTIAFGFNIVKRDKDAFEFEAKRTDPNKQKAEDRVLIWLDRDEEKPLEKVNLFFLYGRFEEVWVSNKKGIFRIEVDEYYEEARVGQLKESILKISMR